MMELTEYERDMFVNLDTLPIGSIWYNIKDDRPDKDRFITAIKKRIDFKNDYEFNGDYSKFRRIEVFTVPRNNGITFRIKWREDTGELTEKEKNLEVNIKPYDKKKFTVALGRAI